MLKMNELIAAVLGKETEDEYIIRHWPQGVETDCTRLGKDDNDCIAREGTPGKRIDNYLSGWKLV